MSASVAAMLARYDAAEDAWRDARAAAPPEPAGPVRFHHASAAHGSAVVTYRPPGGASACELMVPGTHGWWEAGR